MVDDDDTDARPGLTRLLDALLPVLPSGAMLRLGMTNPPFILDQLEAVAAALRHPNVFSFLHVPVQAGSDRVRGFCLVARVCCCMEEENQSEPPSNTNTMTTTIII